MWQISNPPVNGASLGSYLVKNTFISENGLTKIGDRVQLLYLTGLNMVEGIYKNQRTV